MALGGWKSPACLLVGTPISPLPISWKAFEGLTEGITVTKAMTGTAGEEQIESQRIGNYGAGNGI